MVLLHIIEVLLLVIVVFNVLYYFIYSIAGIFYKNTVPPLTASFKKIVVVIPAYKEDSIIFDTAFQALRQTYPKSRFDVIVIADQLETITISHLRRLPIQVQEVHFKASTKIRSIHATISALQENSYDGIVILDADNVMDPAFLGLANRYLQAGYKAVQGKRMVKNENSSLALLDGINEEISHHIFRKGHRAMGLSSALSGSGMIFDFSFFRQILSSIDLGTVGEDKLIELEIIAKNHPIAYAETAIVYDEKVSKNQHFVSQRTRWMAVQLSFFRKYIVNGIRLLFQGNFDYFDKSLQHLLMPKVLLIGGLFLATVLSLLLPLSNWWGIMFFTFCFALVVAFPTNRLNRQALHSLAAIPAIFFLMLKALFSIRRNSSSTFNVTKKSFKGTDPLIPGKKHFSM